MRRIILLLILLCFLPLSAKPSDSIAGSRDVIHSQWYSHVEQLERRVDIYVPEAEGPLPVLYLIHGINGYEGSWQEKGSAVDSLIALITTGRCQPMILVMPDCNKWPFKPHPGPRNLWTSLLRYPRLSHEHEIEHAVSDLIDLVDSTYAVSAHCAIAGLSDGARIAANVANLRPDRIDAVGLFSPVLHKDQMPKDSTQIYCIYVGKTDIFQASGARFHRRLKRNGHPHRFSVMEGSHNWRIWQRCLSDFIENL